MGKKVAKKEEVMLAKKFSSEDAKRYILHCGRYNFDTENTLETFAKETLPNVLKINSIPTKKDVEALNKLTLAYGLETGQPLSESVEKRFWGLAAQVKRELEHEYDCKKSSEKALVDIVVNSYVRRISISKKFEICQNFERFSNERTNYLGMLSKEIDRAHRQFLSGLEMLRIMKQPTLKVNVKTNNAFIGENQQFNNNQAQKNETNEPK